MLRPVHFLVCVLEGLKSTGKNWWNQRRPLSGPATFDLLVLALTRRGTTGLDFLAHLPPPPQGNHEAEVPSAKSQISRSAIPTLRNREAWGNFYCVSAGKTQRRGAWTPLFPFKFGSHQAELKVVKVMGTEVPI